MKFSPLAAVVGPLQLAVICLASLVPLSLHAVLLDTLSFGNPEAEKAHQVAADNSDVVQGAGWTRPRAVCCPPEVGIGREESWRSR